MKRSGIEGFKFSGFRKLHPGYLPSINISESQYAFDQMVLNDAELAEPVPEFYKSSGKTICMARGRPKDGAYGCAHEFDQTMSW